MAEAFQVLAEKGVGHALPIGVLKIDPWQPNFERWNQVGGKDLDKVIDDAISKVLATDKQDM